MKRAMALMAGLGLLAMHVLAADMSQLLKVDAGLDTPYHEVVTSREATTSAVEDSSSGAIFEAFAPPAITTPTQTVISTPRDTTEPQPTSEATLVPESTYVPSPASQPPNTGAPKTPSLPSSTSTQMVTPAMDGTATPVLEPTQAIVRESATAPREMPSAMPAQETETATVTWATWTATGTNVATAITTYTDRAGFSPSPFLLDRLVRNKPSMWGHKGFYVLLGVLYLTLLLLFLKQIISPFRRRP